MHPIVKKYIETKNAQYKANEQQDRNSFLLSEGIFEKEYAPDGEIDSSKYPEYEWDQNTNKTKYYKAVPINVTDEEYEQIKKAYSLSVDKKNLRSLNPIYVTLVIVSVLIFVSTFICGCVFATQTYSSYFSSYSHTEFRFEVALLYWGIGFASGMIFLALAEIIKLLDKKTDD